MLYPNYSKVDRIAKEQGVEDVYYQVAIHSLNTSKKVPEIAITYNDKLNRNGIETMEMERKMTNVKEEDKV